MNPSQNHLHPKTGNIVTMKCRASFEHVLKPGKPMAREDGSLAEPKYSLTLLFPQGADLSLLKKAAQNAAKEKWGDNVPKALKTPFRDQGEKEFDGYVDGAIFINATSTKPPGVVYEDGQTAITDARDFYSGCYCRATLRAYAYGGKGTKYAPGVAFGLQNVQKLGDGEPLGGRTRPEDEFEPVVGAENSGGGNEEGAGGIFD